MWYMIYVGRQIKALEICLTERGKDDRVVNDMKIDFRCRGDMKTNLSNEKGDRVKWKVQL